MSIRNKLIAGYVLVAAWWLMMPQILQKVQQMPWRAQDTSC